MNDREGLTIIGGARRWPGLRLAVENVRSWEWQSYARREPRRARERLAPLRPSAWPDSGVHILAEVPDGKES